MGILDIFRGSKDSRIANRLMTEMRARGETRDMEFDAAKMLVLVLDEKRERVATWNLVHLRNEIRQSDESEHDSIYQRYANGFLDLSVQPDVSYSAARERLRILLKDSAYPNFIWLLNQVEHPTAKNSPLVWRPIGADVIACCIEESARGLRFVTELTTEGWGVTAEQALDDAIANVRALPIEIGAVDSARFFNAQDSFIAARLVCEDKIRALPLKGVPVAVVPDRDTIFFAGSEDEDALSRLAALNQQQLEQASRMVSVRPLVLTETGWQEFVPPESSRAAFANVARQHATTNWAETQKVIEKDLETRGEDIFVAQMQLFNEVATNEYFTTAVWTRAVDTILPAVDRVNFHDGLDASTRMAIWSEVHRVMGDSMVQLEGLPVRYRVNVFPTPEQFLAMGAKAL